MQTAKRAGEARATTGVGVVKDGRVGWSLAARRESWTGRGDQIRAQLAMIEDDIIG